MREMLVAPVRRWSIVVGKCLGGATAGAVQGVLVIALAGLVHVPYAPALIATLLAELVLLSFAITALGVLVAIRIKTMRSPSWPSCRCSSCPSSSSPAPSTRSTICRGGSAS